MVESVRAVVRQPVVILWLSLVVMDLMVLFLVYLALGYYWGGGDNNMDDKDKLRLFEEALRIIALSYKYRPDRKDTPPYEIAMDALEEAGVDLDSIPDYDDSEA